MSEKKGFTQEQKEILEKLTQEQRAIYLQAFKQFDQDGDGTISTKELGVVMRKLGQNPTEAELADLVCEIDQDKNGEIDFEEFLYMMAKKVSDSDLKERSLEAFRVFDKNNKGMIHINELKHILSDIGEKISEADVKELLKDVEISPNGEFDYNDFVNNIFANL